jgi:hypothetical protein
MEVCEILNNDPALPLEVAWRVKLPGSAIVRLSVGKALFIAVDTGELIFIDLTHALPPTQSPRVILQKYVKALEHMGSQIAVRTVDYLRRVCQRARSTPQGVYPSPCRSLGTDKPLFLIGYASSYAHNKNMLCRMDRRCRAGFSMSAAPVFGRDSLRLALTGRF